ncbi:hypothetical protein E2C01_012497 [Portunus trituberculatus]|uniref:Uncharacterized protein n=1 Tax=Portunus trituberculatus TaxID=210409 RepID=A0A5B7DEC5_PORTR|nr:hypothetical protein [Portunus trituberculatus]
MFWRESDLRETGTKTNELLTFSTFPPQLRAPSIPSATRKAAPARRAVVRASRSCLGSVTPIASVVALHVSKLVHQELKWVDEFNIV